MNKEEFCEELLEKAKKINIQLNKEQQNQFYNYMQLLIEWNQKINLTAITEPKEIILKHFIDSLTIIKQIDKEAKVVDIGTGAGFPGIPLKIVNPSLNITLVDSLNKRINFLNEVIETLNLKRIETVHARVEEFGKNKKYREQYDIVTSRAVSNLNVLAEYMIPLAKVEGKCICMKGLEVKKEIDGSKRAISILGGRIEEIETFELANEDIKRNIIVIKKEKNTPNKYPRKPGTPVKDPLK